MAAPVAALAAAPGPVSHCAEVRNDDAVQGYDPALKSGLLKAYARLFPQARIPDERMLQAEAHTRCMGGKLLACFTGANLPCEKLDTEPENAGAATFCAGNPDAAIVPAYAAGHDSAWSFHCVHGQPAVSGEAFHLDARGFAASLWAPVN
jgi:hypothetical protein